MLAVYVSCFATAGGIPPNGNYELVCAQKAHFSLRQLFFLLSSTTDGVGGGSRATEKGVFNFSLAQSRASH